MSTKLGCFTLRFLGLASNIANFLTRCQAISGGIQEIESNRKAQALILTSSTPVFCAGLDLTELHQPRRLVEFWTAFQQLFIDLYGSRLATIAGVSGPAPAAGCMLAMACDYRIMKSSSSTVIGLNEAQFGIIAPPWMAELMVHTVGHRRAEHALMLGTLYSASDALDIGLVDEIVEDDMMEACQKEANRWTKIPPHSRVATKQLLRKPMLEKLVTKRQEDLDLFCEVCLSDKVQTNLGLYLESLKKKQEARNKKD